LVAVEANEFSGDLAADGAAESYFAVAAEDDFADFVFGFASAVASAAWADVFEFLGFGGGSRHGCAPLTACRGIFEPRRLGNTV